MINFKIKNDYITLGQFLKAQGIVGYGGEVKVFLSETEIKYNGNHENRRGKKIYPGDEIELLGEKYRFE